MPESLQRRLARRYHPPHVAELPLPLLGIFDGEVLAPPLGDEILLLQLLLHCIIIADGVLVRLAIAFNGVLSPAITMCECAVCCDVA